MKVTLEGSHICHAVKMALHISENAVLESIFTEHWGYHHKIKDSLSGKVDHPPLLISFKN